MALVNAGYMGWLDVNGKQLRITDSSLVAKQEPQSPDLMGGNWDRLAWNFGKVEISGTVSGPIDEFFDLSGGIWDWATKRDSCGAMLLNNPVTVYYYCDSVGQEGMLFPQLLVNSMTISCAAGDVAKFSLDLVGAGEISYVAYEHPTQLNDAKLLTWDKVAAAITNIGQSAGTIGTANMSNFEFSINNNITAQYALGQPNLFPFALVTGIRTITGSFSVYNITGPLGRDKWDNYSAAPHGEISFSLANQTFSPIYAEFHRVTPAGQVGPIVSTINYLGIGVQSALN